MAKMRTRLKKLLAVTLAVSMTMSLLNLTAFATDGSDPLTVEVGQTLDLSGRDDGSTSSEPVTDPDGTPDESWSSDTPSVATVDENGIVTGQLQGSAVITHTSYSYLWTNPEDDSQQSYYDLDKVDDPDENMTLQRTVTTWEIQVPGPAAEVGDTAYNTLDEAVEKAPEGSTIVLLRDCTLNKGFNKTLTFTGNGTITIDKQLKSNGEGWMCFGLGDSSRVLTFDGKGVQVEWMSDGPTPWLMLSLSGTLNVTNGASLTFLFDSRTTNTRNAIYMNSGAVINVEKGSTFQILGLGTSGNEGQGIQLDAAAQSEINVTGGSTFLIDGTNRGYVSSRTILVEDSTFAVQNCTSNGSNGGKFTAINSNIIYENNAGHGLSADNVIFEDSTVNCNGNAYYGFTYSGTLTMDGTSVLNANENGYGYTGGGVRAASASGVSLVEAGAQVNILNNQHNGLENYGQFTFEDGVVLRINQNDERTTNGGGIFNGAAGVLTLPADTQIMNNHAAQTGGGICNAGTVVIPESALLYNNHADNAGDDIYSRDTASTSFGSVGSDWVLDDCGHVIDGWYQDGADARWAAHKKPLHTEEFTGYTASPVVGPLALKAAHALLPLEPDDPDLPDWDISKSKKATNLDEDYQSQVTLSLPAASYSQALDVVFVLDGSTSTDEDDLATAASQLLGELAGFENLNTKAGLVIFGGSEPVLYSSGSLLSLEDPANLAALQTEMTDSSYDGMDGRSGSNLQAGVEAARAMLGADRSVSAEDKYMILLTDCAARMWYEDGAAMAQAYWCNDSVYWNSNCDFVDFRYPGNTPCPSFSDTWADAQMGITIGAYGMTEAEKNAASQSDVASTDTVINDPGYYTTYEAAAYYAATSLTEAANEAHLVLVSYPYHNEKNYGQYIESFKAWLDDEGYVTRYDSGSLSTEKIFDNVKDELIQLVDTGSKVVDVIGSGVDNAGNDYNFDFVNQADKLSLTVGGTALAVTTIDENTYGFGTAKDGVYPFLLRYYAKGEDGSSQECFVWEINQPVTKTAPVQLTYSVVLTNPQSTSGTYGVYDEYGTNHETSLLTNLEATLYPVDSTGAAGVPENFAKPTVSYTVETSGGGGGGGTTTSYDLIVRYLEEGTEKVLATAYSTTKVSGSSYDVTDRTEKEIDGYVQTDITGDPVKGTMNSDKEIIVWYVSEEDIEEPETPTTETPENPEDPKDPGTELPDGETPTSELPEEEVPKADVPATGDPSLIWLAASALSGSGLAWLALSERKGKREE